MCQDKIMEFIKAHWKKVLYIFVPVVIVFCLVQYLRPGFISLIITGIKDRTKRLSKKQENGKKPDVSISEIKTEFKPNAIEHAKAWAAFEKFKHYINE